MRAVNLLPPDLRGRPRLPQRRLRPRGHGRLGAFVVLGVLAACVAALAGYVLTDEHGQGSSGRARPRSPRRRPPSSASGRQLKPYADFELRPQTRVQTVRTSPASRFDWEQSLRDLSRAVPGRRHADALSGDICTAAQSGGADDRCAARSPPRRSPAGLHAGQTAVAAPDRAPARRRRRHPRRISKSVRSDPSTTAVAPGGHGKPCYGKRPPTSPSSSSSSAPTPRPPFGRDRGRHEQADQRDRSGHGQHKICIRDSSVQKGSEGADECRFVIWPLFDSSPVVNTGVPNAILKYVIHCAEYYSRS